MYRQCRGGFWTESTTSVIIALESFAALRWRRANDGSKPFAVPHRTKMMCLRKSAVLARGLQMTPLGLTFGGTPFPPSLLRQRRFLLSRVLPHPALPARGSWHREPSPPPLDQGCLLLSTRNNTPITRARPLCLPIGSLGNSTFPKGPGSDWLGDLSVKWASRKDAAGVLGTRSPEPRRSNLPINKMGAPQESGDWGGELKPSPAPGPHWSGEGRAQSWGIPPSTSRPCCSCKHVSLHVCFSFSSRGHYRLLFTKILPGSAVPWDPVLHSPCLSTLFHAFSFS